MTLLRSDENIGPYRLVQQVIDDTDYDAYLFQDADDWSAPDRLERLLEHAEREGADMIGSQEVRIFCDEPRRADPVAARRQRAVHGARDGVPAAASDHAGLARAAEGGRRVLDGLRFGGDAEFLRRAHYVATLREHARITATSAACARAR